MKTTSAKIATMGATLGIVAVLLTLSGALTPVLASPQSTNTNTNSTTIASSNNSIVPPLSVGQTITITSTQGHFRVLGDAKGERAPANGTVTFTVTGKYVSGYTLSITSGTLNLNGTVFTVSSGTAQTGPRDHHMVGQGTATTATPATTAPATFLLRATARGSFGGLYATMSLDLQNGSTEYAIALVGTIQS